MLAAATSACAARTQHAHIEQACTLCAHAGMHAGRCTLEDRTCEILSTLLRASCSGTAEGRAQACTMHTPGLHERCGSLLQVVEQEPKPGTQALRHNPHPTDRHQNQHQHTDTKSHFFLPFSSLFVCEQQENVRGAAATVVVMAVGRAAPSGTRATPQRRPAHGHSETTGLVVAAIDCNGDTCTGMACVRANRAMLLP